MVRFFLAFLITPVIIFRLRGIMDSRLEGKYVTGQASEIAMLALRCLVRNPKFRPSMKEVAETLEKIKTRAYNQKHLAIVPKFWTLSIF
jgi:interleukin-1 receptor-associated kinase 1